MVVALHVQLCKATSWRLAADDRKVNSYSTVHVSLGEYSDSELAEHSGSSVGKKIVCAALTDVKIDDHIIRCTSGSGCPLSVFISLN